MAPESAPIPPERDRARGALLGLALGDALGMPTQTCDRAEIARLYGRIEGFVAPVADHPVAHGLTAGQTTDDTEQSFLLAERLIASSDGLDEAAWVRDLREWEAGVRRRGLRDLLGPSSKAALDAIARGVPAAEAACRGTTNGAAMRITPLGIAVPPGNIPDLVTRVESACRVTHNTGEAIAAAAAVAAVVSAGVGGMGFEAAIPIALEAAAEGQTRGARTGEDDMAGRISSALDLARQDGASAGMIAARTGTSVASRESVPAAFALLLHAGGDAWRAALAAANAGDDTDTIGAIAGAMGGACSGAQALPAERVAELRAANSLPVERVADALLALRHRTEPGGGRRAAS